VAANGGRVYIRIMQIKLRIRRQNRSTFGGTPRQLRCHPARSGEFANLDAFTLERVVNQYLLYFYSETLKEVIYENQKKRKAYASDRWEHKVVKSCLVAIKAPKRVKRSKNTGYTGGNEVICVIL